MAYKTPGVYVEEISLFPPSVAEVETAIPAFIGYTEKAEHKGEDLTSVPKKISSLPEYQQLYGGAYEIRSVDVVVDPGNSYAVDSVAPDKRYYLYDSLRLFFDNGGGNCYIVSVGRYGDTVQNGDEANPSASPGLRVGLKALEQFDEPTIILFPDAVSLATEASFYALQQRALAQCARLQDRVCVLDLKEGSLEWQQSVDRFRDNIGTNNLKYGAAYTPWLYSAHPKTVDFSLFKDNVKDRTNNAQVLLDQITSDSDLNALVTTAATTIADQSTLSSKLASLRGSEKTLMDRYARLRNTLVAADDAGAGAALDSLLGLVRHVALDIPCWDAAVHGENLSRDLDTHALHKLKSAVHDLIQLEKNADALGLTGRSIGQIDADYGIGIYDPDPATGYIGPGWLEEFDTDSPVIGAAVENIDASDTDYSDTGSLGKYATALKVAGDLDGIFEDIENFIQDVLDAADAHADMAQKMLYAGHTVIGNIVEHIKKEFSKVPPSGAIAGVYAFVDRTRGVWKAPADVSVASVLAPVQPIHFNDLEELNVDVTGGKSINAIRAINGRGAAIVWGARTLAGNDNEWRYVPVRRFFNMVEESVKKSTAWAVFEPNATSLWTKVKSIIANYLTQKWREGALAGATPDEAFFVKIGQGETMTAQDVLEGRLIVEIGMAVIRPAEFIILRFAHEMQEK